MTDRIIAFTVTLDEMTRDDDVEDIVNAIGMVRGVSGCVPVVAEPMVHWALQKARTEMIGKLHDLIGELRDK